MYLPSLLLSKMGRFQPKQPATVLEFPVLPRTLRHASPHLSAAPGPVQRVAWRPGRQRGVVPGGLLCAAAMVLPAMGCESTTPEVEDTALVTDGTSFRLDTATVSGNLIYRGEIPYSFTNRTGSSVYVRTDCLGSIHRGLEMHEDGEWESIMGQVLVACEGAPIVIEPDEVYRTTLKVAACKVGSCAPKIRLSPNASTPYRIVWYEALFSYDYDEYPPGELIPLEERVSNRFTLRFPD